MQLVQDLLGADLADLSGRIAGGGVRWGVTHHFSLADHPRDLVRHGAQHVLDACVHLGCNLLRGQPVHTHLQFLLLFELPAQLHGGHGQGAGLHGVGHLVAVAV